MRAFPLAALSVSIAGCAGFGMRVPALPEGGDYRLVSRSAALPRGRVTADCGPEALCALLLFYGKPADVDEITARVYRRDLQGTLSTAIAPLAREKGLTVTFLRGSVGRLRDAIDRDAPSLIMVEVRPKLYHFFVVVGYSDAKQQIVCEDYDGGKTLISYEELEASWRGTDHYHAELKPADAEGDAAAAIEFEAGGEYRRAIEYYRRALEKEPEHVQTLIGLGNCLNAMGDRAGARQTYEKALTLAPDEPKLCNNLADLYRTIGERLEEAEALAEKAVAEVRKRRTELEQEILTAHPMNRDQIRRDLRDVDLDLAGAFGTLGQVLAARGTHDRAIGAFKASLDQMPSTEVDWKARRLFEIGCSYEELRMGREARKHYTQALEIVTDAELRKAIEGKLK
ncbi:MAG: tetratricopeptide repeat protein [Planctomycetes bacterium]|nr:tetratricopeptide repeat protein [Planctomycetota bacterium]